MRNYLEIALQYCDDVKTGVRIAGKLEKLAVDRFLRDLSRSGFALSDDVSVERLLTKLKVKTKPDISFPYILNLRRAEHACFFIETCPHVKGKLAKPNRDGSRNKLVMEPWQVFATLNIFGWVSVEDGLRRFLYVYIEVAKKNGKSTWLAGFALYLAFIDGEVGAEVYTAATSREQAKIVFEDAKKIF